MKWSLCWCHVCFCNPCVHAELHQQKCVRKLCSATINAGVKHLDCKTFTGNLRKNKQTNREFETFLALQIRDSKKSFGKKLRLQDTQPLKKETARPMKFNTNFEALMAFERPSTTPPLGNCMSGSSNCAKQSSIGPWQ